jgi:hypothetical protein
MVKRLVILDQSQIDYVWRLAKQISDPRAKQGDFSKALRKIIDDHKNGQRKRE